LKLLSSADFRLTQPLNQDKPSNLFAAVADFIEHLDPVEMISRLSLLMAEPAIFI
jgi:hypothetical protein